VPPPPASAWNRHCPCCWCVGCGSKAPSPPLLLLLLLTLGTTGADVRTYVHGTYVQDNIIFITVHSVSRPLRAIRATRYFSKWAWS